MPDFVRSLIAVCRSANYNIRAVLLYREFFSARVFEALEKMGARYLVPCKNTDVVMDAIAKFVAGRRPAASEMSITNAKRVSVKYTTIMAERKKKRKKSGKEKSDGVDLCPEEKFIGSATNVQFKNPELYSKICGIETRYRMIEKTRGRSTKTVSRIVCFLYSEVIFNSWVMINTMLSVVYKSVEKTRKRMTQTQLRIKIIAVLVRYEPSSKALPVIGSLYPY